MISDDDGGPRPARRRRVRMLQAEKEKKHKRALAAGVGHLGMWPLDAPGMPPPGPDFLAAALATGDATEYVKGTKAKPTVFVPGGGLTELYRRALREPGFSLSVKVREGKYAPVTFVPGHIWGQHADAWAKSFYSKDPPPKVDGPHPADVFVLGKMPWKEEVREGRNLVNATGEILAELVAKMHVKRAAKWYVSNLCKFMPPDEGRDLKAGWVHDCLPLLAAELRIVRPRYVLCLGAEASKWLLGEKFNVSYMAGRVVPHTFDVRLSEDDDTPPHTCHVMTVIHPVNVAKDPAQARILESNFGRFANLLATDNLDLDEKGLDHRACYCLEDALDWISEATYDLMQQPERLRLTGWDLEWEGQHPVNKGSYVRTIQCSWGDKKAITFVTAHPGGKCAFRDRDGRPAIKRLVRALNEFVRISRPVGHFLISDLEWAESIGLRLVDHCPVPLYDADDGTKAWEMFRDGKGWLCTGMMNHAIEETAPLGLEILTMRYTMAPRYDIPLEDWKTEYTRQLKLKKEGLEGYGNCPDKILIDYANYDADVTRRIAVSLLPLLDRDYEGNCCWEPFWESMIIQVPILRMHQTGIMACRRRIDDLTKKFITWRARKEEEIRDWAKWHGNPPKQPAFNIRSVQHVREFLFGERLNGKRDEHGNTVRIRPPGARSLYIEPLLDTAKPPRRWKDLVERGLDRDASPGTGKMILGILAQENPKEFDQINMVRDYRFLDQVLKSVLRHPLVDEDDPEHGWIENDDGFLEYDAGLAHSIDDDGRVRTHMYPTAETGRWKHSRPNLANISKARDPDYVRLLGGHKNDKGKWVGGDYDKTLRSILHASPGYAIVEADYSGAELALMAMLSRSKKMQDHCRRALLPDEGYDAQGNKADGGKFPHPDYYDIHSNVAVLAFRLDCAPTKHGLGEIGKAHFRTLAKNVIFGIAYGRQAKAIALQAKEQGINVTPDDAQKVIDAIFEMYPELPPFFAEAKSRALGEKWLCNCFGRFRRFPSTTDYKLEGEFERQAMNFPIQSSVASCVDRGTAYLVDRIAQLGLQDDIRVLLTIHDAVVTEAKYHLVGYAQDLIRWAYVDMVEIWPTNLAGKPNGDGPYRLGMDFGVYKHWGEKWSYEEAVKVGLDPKFAAKPKPPTDMPAKAKK